MSDHNGPVAQTGTTANSEGGRVVGFARARDPGAIVFPQKRESHIAQWLVDEHGGVDALVFDEGEFWVWEPPRWKRLEPICLKRVLSDADLGGRFYYRALSQGGEPTKRPWILSNRTQENIVQQAETRAYRAGFFADAPAGIGFANVFLAIEGRDVRAVPYGREHRQKFAFEFPFDPDAEAPRLMKLLAQVLEPVDTHDDLQTRIALVQQWAGGALFGIAPRFHAALALIGPRGCGKSQILDVLGSVFPPAAVCAVPPHQLHDDYKIVELRGRRLNLVAELPHEHPITRSTRLKEVIDGGLITGRKIYSPPVTFRPAAAHLFAANRLPRVPGVDASFFDRWILIPVRRRFRGTTEEVRRIGQTIAEEERAGVVAWMVRGLRELLKTDALPLPSSSRTEMSIWSGTADVVPRFVKERCCVRGLPHAARQWPSTDTAYSVFRDWCGERCRARAAGRVLGWTQSVQRAGPALKWCSSGVEHRLTGPTGRHHSGVAVLVPTLRLHRHPSSHLSQEVK